ncbi:5-(carboxyamino)imidazole ribonucleotide synthase [Caldimonas thermodepolymerans]|uniref:5-(carboxyamino)imidazole ribonucleotide synthase n=1 Tax=Caldimonas thermodepolymerans TaxID=215580 RepID=UPI00223667E5|nr:5-(carboxyamino)imidazole ribonucleotide synthase [Caldimonas thermodepolymerans]UZG45029.1 5-(carboxyamino)imidazole ribonucleotide synthase [Caldimonas thermodepolymerans]
MSRRTVLPGAGTLGVLGGGQLGRMFVHAAQELGYRTVVLDPDPDSPAGLVAHRHLRCDYLDPQGLDELAGLCDAVTTEFENVPAEALARLARTLPVAPAAEAVAICQDRAREKAHFTACGVPCAPHAVIADEAQLQAVDPGLLPGILKTARLGYDGKGQVGVRTPEELAAAWDELQRVPCVLEKRLDLAFEVSVIVARNAQGELVHFPLQQNLHRDGILAVTSVPAPQVTPELQAQAVRAAEAVAASMGYVGVLCVEFFVLADGTLVANEMAPRPHNSGHYTLDACDVSQFGLQVRAMAGLPLPAPRLHSPAIMLNLLGDLWFRHGEAETTPPWDAVLALPGTHLHLYGKVSARRGRKMGHLNVTGASAAQVREVALRCSELLGLDPF